MNEIKIEYNIRWWIKFEELNYSVCKLVMIYINIKNKWMKLKLNL